MPDELPELLPDEEPGGIVEDGVSVLVAPPVLVPLAPLVPLVPLVPDDLPLPDPDSDGMPLVPPEDAPVPPGELPLVPEPEPPPVMPAQAPSSTAQAMGNIHLVIEHSR